MSDEDYQNRMDVLSVARQQRDAAVDAAQAQFTDTIVVAYEGGLTLYDINTATGLSITTIRARLKERGVKARKP